MQEKDKKTPARSEPARRPVHADLIQQPITLKEPGQPLQEGVQEPQAKESPQESQESLDQLAHSIREEQTAYEAVMTPACKQGARRLWKMGQKGKRAKNLCKVAGKNWKQWCKEEHINHSYVTRAIHVFDFFPSEEAVQNMTGQDAMIACGALRQPKESAPADLSGLDTSGLDEALADTLTTLSDTVATLKAMPSAIINSEWTQEAHNRAGEMLATLEHVVGRLKKTLDIADVEEAPAVAGVEEPVAAPQV